MHVLVDSYLIFRMLITIEDSGYAHIQIIIFHNPGYGTQMCIPSLLLSSGGFGA